MRIENITKENLEKASDKDLNWLRLRFMQVWNKHFRGNIEKSANGLDRKDILIKYSWLMSVMKNRSIEHSTEDIDRQHFKRAMEISKVGIDISQFEPISLSTECLFIKKDFLNDQVVEVTVLAQDGYRDDDLEKAVTDMFKKQIEKDVVFKYTRNIEGEYFSLFNNVLMPVEKLNSIKVDYSKSESEETEDKKFEKEIEIVPIGKADEQIVCGIVYEPDTVDSQGDKASEEEIRKAAYKFMEEVQVFKVNHKGRQVKVKILENYISPVDFKVKGKNIKKGSWVLVARVLDKNLWNDIKAGKITGYSMAGFAKVS